MYPDLTLEKKIFWNISKFIVHQFYGCSYLDTMEGFTTSRETMTYSCERVPNSSWFPFPAWEITGDELFRDCKPTVLVLGEDSEGLSDWGDWLLVRWGAASGLAVVEWDEGTTGALFGGGEEACERFVELMAGGEDTCGVLDASGSATGSGEGVSEPDLNCWKGTGSDDTFAGACGAEGCSIAPVWIARPGIRQREITKYQITAWCQYRSPLNVRTSSSPSCERLLWWSRVWLRCLGNRSTLAFLIHVSGRILNIDVYGLFT